MIKHTGAGASGSRHLTQAALQSQRDCGSLLSSLPAVPLILLNKPFRVLCQFRDDQGRSTLADFIDVPGVYPAGRLDFDSEGLTLLTDDGKLQARISSPGAKVPKHYWVQVDGTANDAQLDLLRQGVMLKDGPAAAIGAAIIDEPARLWPRDPPIRVRQKIPTTWLELVIDEGRNRQVRRMTAAVGLPTLRLIRHRIGPFELGPLAIGESTSMKNTEAWRQLGM